MAANRLLQALRFLGNSLRSQGSLGATDGDLLSRFVQDKDERAFEELMRRHAPMVFGVCRRMLGNAADAEDAFQAAFLVLVRRARAIHPPGRVGNWLHGVALRTALESRRTRARRRAREAQTMPRPAREELPPELLTLLDEELARLPDKYRSVIVLCELEGRTRTAAAQELGCAEGTVASRLARGRALLAKRLSIRGVGLSGAALVGVLAEQAAAAGAPTVLLAGTLRTAVLLNTGQTLATVASAQVAALVEGAVKAMFLSKLKIEAMLLVVALALGGAGLATYLFAAGLHDSPNPPTPPRAEIKPPDPGPRLDANGDPLPAGAVARLGQDRWLHDTMARFATFLPDGKKFVTVNTDRTIRVFEVPSGKELRCINLSASDVGAAQPFGARTAALSNDGKIIATWLPEEPSTIYLHDLSTGKRLEGIQAPSAVPPNANPTRAVTSLAFSPDDQHLAGMTNENKIRIWDVTTGKEVGEFPISKQGGVDFPHFCYAPDGKRIATAHGREVKLWNPATGIEVRTIHCNNITGARNLTFSPDGKLLAIANVALANPVKPGWVGEDSIVLVESAKGMEVGTLAVPKLRLNPSGGGPGLVFSKDAAKLYVYSYRNKLMEWDVAGKKLLREFASPAIFGPIAMAPDGKTLLGTGVGPMLLDVGGKEITALNSPSPRLATVQFTPDGKHLLTLRGRGEEHPENSPLVRIFDAATGKESRQLSLPGLSAPFALSFDGKVIAAFEPTEQEHPEAGKRPVEVTASTVVLVDTASGKEIGRLSVQPLNPLVLIPSRMRFSPDGKLLAISAAKGKGGMELYELPDLKLRHTLKFQAGPAASDKGPRETNSGNWLRTMIFSPDGKTFAANGSLRTLDLWDTTTGQRTGSLPLPKDGKLLYDWRDHLGMESAAFSPDGRSLVMDMADGTATLYDLATAQPRRSFGKPRVPPVATKQLSGQSYLLPDEFKAGSCFAFSPDGKRLAQSGFDRIVHLWDVETGRERAAFQGHTAAVTGVAFAPDGKTVASASKDGTALIWDVSELGRFPQP